MRKRSLRPPTAYPVTDVATPSSSGADRWSRGSPRVDDAGRRQPDTIPFLAQLDAPFHQASPVVPASGAFATRTPGRDQGRFSEIKGLHDDLQRRTHDGMDRPALPLLPSSAVAQRLALHRDGDHAGDRCTATSSACIGRGEEGDRVVLQLGGNDPADLARCAQLGQAYGYQAINLNCGCPSDRVLQGAFGACLMAQPRPGRAMRGGDEGRGRPTGDGQAPDRHRPRRGLCLRARLRRHGRSRRLLAFHRARAQCLARRAEPQGEPRDSAVAPRGGASPGRQTSPAMRSRSTAACRSLAHGREAADGLAGAMFGRARLPPALPARRDRRARRRLLAARWSTGWSAYLVAQRAQRRRGAPPRTAPAGALSRRTGGTPLAADAERQRTARRQRPGPAAARRGTRSRARRSGRCVEAA